MAIYDYDINPEIGVEGMLWGTQEHDTRPAQLVLAAAVHTIVITAGAETADYVQTIVDDESAQSYELTVGGDADESVLAAAILAAFPGSEQSKIFSIGVVNAGSGSDITVTLTARHGNRDYTVSATGGTAVGTPVSANPTPAGATGLAFGRMVDKGAADQSFQVVSGGTTVSSIAGFLYRTVGGVIRDLAEDPNAVDVSRVGQHLPMLLRGRALVRVEAAVTPATAPFLRTAADGALTALGGFSNGAGTGLIAASAICEFETSAPAGGLAVLRLTR